MAPSDSPTLDLLNRIETIVDFVIGKSEFTGAFKLLYEVNLRFKIQQVCIFLNTVVALWLYAAVTVIKSRDGNTSLKARYGIIIDNMW